ncbi:MAG: Pycsar system effector family protein [Desulfobulbaceae bacterium]
MNKDNIDILDKTLSKTNDWLKFAEAKNGALIAIACTVLLGVFRAVSNLNSIHIIFKAYLCSFFLFCSIALTISLLSFIPRLKPPFWFKNIENPDKDNPFFFGHACKYNSYNYLELFNISGSSSVDKTELRLADQIITNSKIAFLKYEMFSIAAWCFLSAFLTPVGALLIWALKE